MALHSLEFIFIFLPVFLLLYYRLPARFRNLLLLVGSLAFYLLGVLVSPWHILVLLVSVVITWVLGLFIAPEDSDASSKPLLVVGIVINLLILFVFKHCRTLFATLSGLFGTGNSLLELRWVLPLGLSFFTLTHIAYLVDIYRRAIRPEPSILRFACFSAFFPKLAAGPITLWQEMDAPLSRRGISMPRLDNGLRDFIIGLGLKVLLADQISGMWSRIGEMGYANISTPLAWMGSLAFALKLYFDFYGYSLMALGAGKMLGFRLPDNFHHPYCARTMTDFWRRWHITLTNWFRNYLYQPLGGSRCSGGRQILNLLIVWLATALWHGAGLNFLLWGLLLFVILCSERFFTMGLLTGDGLGSQIGSHVYMIVLILLQWTVFAISSTKDLGIYLGRLIGIGTAANQLDYIGFLGSYGWLLVLGIIFATPLPRKLFRPIRSRLPGTLILFAVFALAIYCISIGRSEPFFYYHF